MKPTDDMKTILEEAAQIADSDREKTYGDPGANCRRIAAIWATILGVNVTAEQVCLCMIGLKIARLTNTPGHRDSLVDVAGYARLLERIQEAEKKPKGDACEPIPRLRKCIRCDFNYVGIEAPPHNTKLPGHKSICDGEGRIGWRVDR